MKRFLLIALCAPAIFGFTDMLIRSGGLAAMDGVDATGGPYATTTCGTCHFGGAFTPSISMAVRDSLNNLITEYTPGYTYFVTYTLTSSTGSPAGFGMQSVALTAEADPGGVPLNPGANTQITPLNGRNYIEHNTINPTGIFTVEWTAPSQGTGPITFYYTGNAVNGANGPGLDNWAGQDSLILGEYCVPVFTQLDPEICTGSGFTVGGNTYTTSGTYHDTLSNTFGCDSVITTNLIVASSFNVNVTGKICEGDTFVSGQSEYTTQGLYVDTLTAAGGCDSIIHLDLLVFPLPNVHFLTEDSVVCVEDTVNIIVSPPGGTLSGYGLSGNEFYADSLGDFGFEYSYTDSNGCSNTDSLFFLVTICDGLNDQYLSSVNITHYNGMLNVAGLPFGGKIEVTSLNGTILLTGKSNGYEMELPFDPPAGIYLFRISVGESVVVRKILLR